MTHRMSSFFIPEPCQVTVVRSRQCPVPECCLPGGQHLPHVDAGGNKLVCDKSTSTAIPVEESGDETFVLSGSSGSELIPDDEEMPNQCHMRKQPDAVERMGYMFEVTIEDCDVAKLVEKSRHAEAAKEGRS